MCRVVQFLPHQASSVLYEKKFASVASQRQKGRGQNYSKLLYSTVKGHTGVMTMMRFGDNETIISALVVCIFFLLLGYVAMQVVNEMRACSADKCARVVRPQYWTRYRRIPPFGHAAQRGYAVDASLEKGMHECYV